MARSVLFLGSQLLPLVFVALNVLPTGVHSARVKAADDIGVAVDVAEVLETSTSMEYEGFMLRRCVTMRVKGWQLGEMPAGLPSVATVIAEQRADAPILERLVARHWELNDAIVKHTLHYNAFKKLVSSMRSSHLRELNANLSTVVKKLELAGFDYTAVEKLCKSGLTAETYQCMLSHAEKESSFTVYGVTLDALVRARIDLEDHMAYKNRYSKAAQVELAAAWRTAKAEIKRLHFSFYHTQKACKKETNNMLLALRRVAIDGLSACSKKGSVCAEADGKMCPEGTSPQINRRIDVVRGSKVAFGVFWGAQVGKVLALGLVGAVLGAPAGPAGVLAGGASGAAAGAVMPGPGPLSVAAFFWASRGAEECACFPRDCFYDESHGTCAIEADVDQPSNNPYGSAAPYLSTKCVRKAKSPSKCEMHACEEKDYAPPLVLPGGRLFGRIGTWNGEVFNCLSTNGKSTGALSLDLTLWNGANNTAEARVALFRGLSPPLPELGGGMADMGRSNQPEGRAGHSEQGSRLDGEP